MEGVILRFGMAYGIVVLAKPGSGFELHPLEAREAKPPRVLGGHSVDADTEEPMRSCLEEW
jgi:hypothetical protein